MIDLVRQTIEQLWQIQRQFTPEIIAMAEQVRENCFWIFMACVGLFAVSLPFSIILGIKLFKYNKETPWACGMGYTGKDLEIIAQAGVRRELYLGTITVICMCVTLVSLIVGVAHINEMTNPLPVLLGFAGK